MDESSLAKRAQQPVNLTKPVAEAELRASDADRDRIAEILREALAVGRLDAEEHSERIDLVYRAKTMGELEPLVRDLPVEGGAPGPRPAAAAYEAEPGGAPPDQNMVAIFSASTRKGRWRVPSRINAVAVFGSVEIDLTEGIFQQQQVRINVTAIFGSVEIRVPENVTLRSSGSGVLGAFEVETNESVEPDAPVVLVNGYAVLGSVEARAKRGKWLRDLRDDLRGARRAWQEQRRDERRSLHEHRRDERRERHVRWHGDRRD
ncbi:hypothetical protein OEIGOIKO_02903 [Streptomyces chrestomyceticus JCM 4735]|uniref:Cell wall-active antibiotics response LiaF-like C-terminal domain-containing protein n=1 Tax=Streptomyces chrestomyceticus JCM 4735 TaxID=1306181 RepID=A0A7U9KTK5_9ACTN|nr:hypothetical protein OEIGOIKO_02903 [Streptomyces chrestomyceticus JCM 4735]